MSKKNPFADLEKLRDEYKKEILKAGKPAILAAFSGLFEKNPEVLSARWHQYTPSFNDGDPCTFSVGDVQVLLAKPKTPEQEEEQEEGDDGFLDSYSVGDDNEKLQKAMEDVSSKLGENDDVLEAVFGNNMQITVTPEGEVDVEEYDCGY